MKPSNPCADNAQIIGLKTDHDILSLDIDQESHYVISL